MAEWKQEPRFSISETRVSSTRKYCLPLKQKNGMPHLSLSPSEKISQTHFHLLFQGAFPNKYPVSTGRLFKSGKFWNTPKYFRKVFGIEKKNCEQVRYKKCTMKKTISGKHQGEWKKPKGGRGGEGRGRKRWVERLRPPCHYLIIHFQTSKHWIFKSHIYSDHMIY